MGYIWGWGGVWGRVCVWGDAGMVAVGRVRGVVGCVVGLWCWAVVCVCGYGREWGLREVWVGWVCVLGSSPDPASPLPAL